MVVALGNSQGDHFESEEAFILPEIYQRFNEEEQLEIVRQLLIDDKAEDPRWVLDWLNQTLPPAECQALIDLCQSE